MRLLSLHLENFKGHKDLTVNFGNVTTIVGANGTGKTSVFDAFMFVLTGKDSLGRVCGSGQKGEATIRPRSADGELVREIEVSVSARLADEDGQVFELRRVYCETYSADKNTGAKIFKGNTTKYYVDNEPMQAARYNAWVKEYIDPERYSLTGNPAYFPTLPWQEQRQWLLKVAGDVFDEAVIASNPELKDLDNLLNRHDIAGIKAMSEEQLRQANKEIKEAVIRVDQTVKLAGNVTESSIIDEINKLEEIVAQEDKNVQGANTAILTAKEGNRAGQVQLEIGNLDLKLDQFRQKHQNLIIQTKAEYKRKAQDLEITKRSAEESIRSKKAVLSGLEETLKDSDNKKRLLYERYDEEDAKQFSSTECPLCHQPLPAEKVETLTAQFNLDKSKRLSDIVDAGKRLVAKMADMKKQQELVTTAIATEGRNIEDAQRELDGMYDAEQKALASLPALENNQDFMTLRNKRDALTRELQMLHDGVDFKPLEEALETAQQKRKEVAGRLSDAQARLRTLQSVKDLEADLQRQREIADAASYTLRLVSQFIQTKCRMLTDKVNTLFPGLEWRLFSKNIGNDDIVETCELLMHGVPYRDLSAGEKIKAGLIVVDVLQEKLEAKNPVFVDGAESITFTPKVKSQLVLLKAQEDVKELTIKEA